MTEAGRQENPTKSKTSGESSVMTFPPLIARDVSTAVPIPVARRAVEVNVELWMAQTKIVRERKSRQKGATPDMDLRERCSKLYLASTPLQRLWYLPHLGYKLQLPEILFVPLFLSALGNIRRIFHRSAWNVLDL